MQEIKQQRENGKNNGLALPSWQGNESIPTRYKTVYGINLLRFHI